MKRKFHDRLKKNTKPPANRNITGMAFNSIDLESSFKRIHSKKEKLFLGFFSRSNIHDMIKQVNLISHLECIGFNDITVAIDIDDNDIHNLKLYHKKIDPDNMLLDLRVSESKFLPEPRFYEDGKHVAYDMIVIEWLSAQDPIHEFSGDKPQLPGQKRPGLGILSYCFEIMRIMAREVNKDGFMDVPDHIHWAIMYAKNFKFFDPAHEGVLHALMRDLKDYSLSDISWGILTLSIIEAYNNQPQTYDPSEQIFYLSDRLRSYFHSGEYKKIFNKYYKRKHFRFEYEEMLQKKKKILESKNIDEL